MLDSSYFSYVKFNVDMPSLVSEINEYVQCRLKKFYVSHNKLCRIDFDGELGDKIIKTMPFEIFGMGCYLNPPMWNYPIHKDDERACTVNMLLSDENPDFEVNFIDSNTEERYPIPYIKNQFLLFNTEKLHYVKNNSKKISRLCVSIGCLSKYDDVRKLLEGNGNIGLYPY